MQEALWNAGAEPVTMPINRLVYEMRAGDSAQGLLLDAVGIGDLLAGPDFERVPQAVLDALAVQVSQMARRVDQLRRVMTAAGGAVAVTDYTISDPVRARGAMQVAVLFALSDGQEVTVWFDNPDELEERLTRVSHKIEAARMKKADEERAAAVRG